MPDYNHTNYLSPNRVFMWVLISSATAAGIYLRLKGLDKAPFTIDEYYIAASVQNILESGFPEFGCGGYYTRGLLYQYILTPFFAYGSNDELYARLVTVASNTLTAPALYLLAKKISGKTVAYAVIVLFFFSVWEIEFSRFARMYAPFQMIFVWYIYFLYKWAFLKENSARLWCHVLSLSSIFIYEGGIFLALLNFLPPLINHKHFRKVDIAINAVILTIAYVYLTTNFRIPSVKTVPNNTSDSGAFMMPTIMTGSLDLASIWFALFLAISSALIFSGIFLVKRLYAERNNYSVAYIAILVVFLILFALINAYSLIISIVVISLALNWITLKDLSPRSFLPLLTATALMLVFWMIYGMFSHNWPDPLEQGILANLKQAIIALLKYPDIYGKVIDLFFQTMPVFSISIGLILFLGFIEAILNSYEERKYYLFIFAIVFGLILCMCILRQPYTSTRYLFFLYPLVILLTVMTVHNFTKIIIKDRHKDYLIITGFLLLFMLVSEDYSLKHYLNIDSDTILYRTAYNEHMEGHLYPRWDFRSPAEMINNQWNPGDAVITSTYATPYYLEHLDYFYNDAIRDNFSITTGCEGEKNLWSNVKQITREKELDALIKQTENTVWIVARSNNYRWNLPVEKLLEAKYANNVVLKTIDGNLNLYKIQ